MRRLAILAFLSPRIIAAIADGSAPANSHDIASHRCSAALLGRAGACAPCYLSGRYSRYEMIAEGEPPRDRAQSIRDGATLRAAPSP